MQAGGHGFKSHPVHFLPIHNEYAIECRERFDGKDVDPLEVDDRLHYNKYKYSVVVCIRNLDEY